MRITTELAQPMEQLGKSIGLDQFPEAAMTVVGEIVKHDMQWIMTYARKGRPIVHHHMVTAEGGSGINRKLIRELYDGGYYRFDPFFRYWRNDGQPGVISMHDLSGEQESSDDYASTFMPLAGVQDDVAILLDCGNNSALGLCIERRERFTEDELAALKNLFPLLSGLTNSHCRISNVSIDSVPSSDIAPLDFDYAVSMFLLDQLTPRERQLVKLALVGFNNASIANRLGVSIGTIKNHRKRIYAKLDITSEREMFSLFLGHIANVDPSELVPENL